MAPAIVVCGQRVRGSGDQPRSRAIDAAIGAAICAVVQRGSEKAGGKAPASPAFGSTPGPHEGAWLPVVGGLSPPDDGGPSEPRTADITPTKQGPPRHEPRRRRRRRHQRSPAHARHGGKAGGGSDGAAVSQPSWHSPSKAVALARVSTRLQASLLPTEQALQAVAASARESTRDGGEGGGGDLLPAVAARRRASPAAVGGAAKGGGGGGAVGAATARRRRLAGEHRRGLEGAAALLAASEARAQALVAESRRRRALEGHASALHGEVESLTELVSDRFSKQTA